jgi:hypothetical protein
MMSNSRETINGIPKESYIKTTHLEYENNQEKEPTFFK